MTEKGKNFIVAVILLAIVGVLVWLAVSLYEPREAPTDGPVVAATIFPLADIARNITGDGVEVVQLLPSGASPHTFELTISNARDVSAAPIIFAVGPGLDAWAEQLGATADARVVEVSRDIDLIQGDEEEGGVNPHYWLAIPNAVEITEIMTEELANTFPSQRSTFEANRDAYIERLNQADEEIRDILTSVANKQIVTFHESYPYFAEEYGLTIIGSFEPNPGIEPSPRELQALQEATQEAGVDIIFSEPQLGTAQLEPFVEDLGLSIVELDPLGGVEGRDNYIDLMLFNARTIAENQ